MSDKTSLGASLRPAGSLLDRGDSSPTPLSENQTLVDQMVSSSVSEAAKGSTLLAMFGAGAVSRLTRMGVMSLSLGEGSPILPILTRGGSYAVALANESVTFAGIERGFHPSQTSFEKDWARAFINLGSLKLLGGAAEGQNLLLQHLLTDLGMVGGQQVGAQFGVVERPQGNFAQQMIQAEVLNWSQKGGMALLHGLSPNLHSMEKSMDLYLRSRETDLFSKGRPALSFFSQLVPEGPEIFSVVSQETEAPKGPDRLEMSNKDGKDGSPRQGGISAVENLIKMANPGDIRTRDESISSLEELAKGGVKSLELAETLHKKAMELKAEAKVLGRRNPLRQENYGRAMELEWSAALAVPPRNEFRRGHLYVNATWLALEAGRPEDAKKIILRALTEDFGAVAEEKLKRSAEKYWFGNKNRRFILNAIEEAKGTLKLLEAFKPQFALAGSSALEKGTPLVFMMSSREAGGKGGSGEKASGSPEKAKDTPSRDPVEIIRELAELAEAGSREATEALAWIAGTKSGEIDALAQVARVEVSGILGGRPSGPEIEPIAMDKLSVCINVGRHYFTENATEDTRIEDANLYVENQGIGKGVLFITNKSDKDLSLMDARGEPQKVEKGIAYPILPGEIFSFNGEWYTWGKVRNKPLPSLRGLSPLPLEQVNALNARILGEEEAKAVFEAGVYYGLKLELLRRGREERTARIPIFLEESSGLIAAVGKVPEELKSKTIPVTLVVRIPDHRARNEKGPMVVGMVLPGSIGQSRILEVVENLKGKIFRYPTHGFPAMEYGKVTLDARRFRTVPLWKSESGEGLH